MNKKFLTVLTSLFAGFVMTSASMVFVPTATAASASAKASAASAKASGDASKPAKKPKKDKKPKASASK